MRFIVLRGGFVGLIPGIVVTIWLFIVHAGAWAYEYPVRLERKPKGTAIELTLVNDGPSFINVIVELQSSSNTGFSPAVLGSKFPHLLKPGESKLIALAVPLKVGKPAQFSYKLKYAFGDPDAAVKTNYVYRLPFLEGHRGVIRPYSGAYISNYLLDTGNAVEFLLPLNTPIVAVRDGIVINARGVKGLADKDTPSNVGNFVSIMHDDGSWATYGWLADESVVVQPGERVKTGQKLALSGANPDAYEDYIVLAVNKNFWALQLKSVPIKFTMYNGEVFDVLAYAGPVSPNLPPKYKVPAKMEAPWSPPESLVPTPKLPVDWNDEHLSPTQRAVVFRQRMSEAADAAGTDSISGSQPLMFLALTAALFGIVGAIAVLASHSTNKPSGVRGLLWNLLRGQSPGGMFPSSEVERRGSIFGPEKARLNEAFVRTPHSDRILSSCQADALEVETAVSDSEQELATTALLDQHRLKLLGLINKVLPEGFFSTSQVPLSRLVKEDLPDAWENVKIDFVLIVATTGQPALAIQLLAGAEDPLLGPISHRLATARIGVLGLHKLPSAGELKSKIKRALI